MDNIITETKRSELPDSVFGIPEERKYPLHDEKHVRSAIKLFNHVDQKYEKQLANKIIAKMKEYNITPNMGDNNRLKKYINESQADLTKFTWYHAEIAKKGFNAKTAGGWDEELYSKDIESCIHNDIEDKAEFKGADKISAHLYTAGEDLSAIYLGRITVWRASDNNKLNWEWEEQIPMKSSDVAYLKDEVQPHLLESFEYIEEGYLNQLFMSVPIKSYNRKNNTPINDMGDLVKYHKNPGCINYVKNCKKIEDLRYMKKDSGSHMLIPQLLKAKERTKLCRELGECDKTKSYYKGIKKLYIDKGVTDKDFDATIEWCKEFDKLIAEKIAELKKSSTNESAILEATKKTDYSYEKIVNSKDIDNFKKSMKKVFGEDDDMDEKNIRSSMKIIKFKDEVIGYIGFSKYNIDGKKYLGIGNFIILPEYQRSGYGTSVVEDIIEKNKSKYDEIYCYVSEDNTKAINFYKKIAKVGSVKNRDGQYYVTIYKKSDIRESLEYFEEGFIPKLDRSKLSDPDYISKVIYDIKQNKDKIDNVGMISSLIGFFTAAVGVATANVALMGVGLGVLLLLPNSDKINDMQYKKISKDIDNAIEKAQKESKKLTGDEKAKLENNIKQLQNSKKRLAAVIDNNNQKNNNNQQSTSKNSDGYINIGKAKIWSYGMYFAENPDTSPVEIKRAKDLLEEWENKDYKQYNKIYFQDHIEEFAFAKYNIETMMKYINANKGNITPQSAEFADTRYINIFKNKTLTDIYEDSSNDQIIYAHEDNFCYLINLKHQDVLERFTVEDLLGASRKALYHLQKAVRERTNESTEYVTEGLGVFEIAFLVFMAAMYGFVGYEKLKEYLDKNKRETGYRYYCSNKPLMKIPSHSYYNDILYDAKGALISHAYAMGIRKAEKNTLIYNTKSDLNGDVYLYRYTWKEKKMELVKSGKYSEICSSYGIKFKALDESKLKDREKAYKIAIDNLKKEIATYTDLKKHCKIGPIYDDDYMEYSNGLENSIIVLNGDVWDIVPNARSDEGHNLIMSKIRNPEQKIIENINKKLPEGYLLEEHGDWDDICIVLVHNSKINESSVEDYLDDDEWDEIEEWTPVSFLSKKTSQAKNKKAHRDYLKKKQKSHKKKYNFFHKHEAALYEDMKNNIIEAEPIFIINSFTNTPFGKIITTYSKSAYSHTAISLDTSLTHMYTFNADNKKNAFGGFSIESIEDYIAYYKDSTIQVNCIFIKKEDMEKIKFVLDNMAEHIPDTRYGFKNIFNIVLNKAKEMTNDAKVMVCSQFVAYILHNTADIRLVNKSDNLVTPKDLSNIDNPRVYKLYEGKAIEYDEKKINRIFRKLKTKAMIIKESLINY